MSDQDAILRILRRAAARQRFQHALSRITLGLGVWAGLGTLVKLLDLAIPLGAGAIQVFWILWFAGVAGIVLYSLRSRPTLRAAARDLDQRARLDDEAVSAWWFIEHPRPDAPWVELHLHRAASRISQLNVPRLYPRSLPKSSALAAGGLVLLAALHLAPLPSIGGSFRTHEAPEPVTDRETLMQEIEELLAQADALDPDGTLAEFQQLMDELRSPEMTLPAVNTGLEDLQSSLGEGNLTMAGILEGLEDMAQELEAAAQTAAVADELAARNLEAAAAELDRLADELAGGTIPGADLADALARAAEDARPGLEPLAGDLAAAAGALESGQEPGPEAADALARAADALRDLSSMVTGQQLRNEASEGIESLQQDLENAQATEGSPSQPGEDQGSSSGEAGAQGSASGEAGDAPPQSGEPGASVEAGESQGEGEASSGDAAAGGETQTGDQGTTGAPGNLQSAAGGDTGLLPAGLGFSPDQKTGAPTSLEVQLQQEATRALAATEEVPGQIPEEEASRQEQSRLDYRNVPSELTPAQQELLNQEQIPREYRNLIRSYFQAIRPPVEP
jgi:hypothetical protein